MIRGPGIPAGTTCDELAGTIDILPTIAAITGKPLPTENKVDGVDVSGLWTGKTDKSPRNEFLYYTSRGQIEGIRQGNWKLLVKKPRARRNRNAANAGNAKILLFDLKKDLAEQNNVASDHPEIVNRLRKRMEDQDAEIGKNARSPWFKS